MLPIGLEPSTLPLCSLLYFVISALEVFKLVRGFLFVFSDNKDQKVSFSVFCLFQVYIDCNFKPLYVVYTIKLAISGLQIRVCTGKLFSSFLIQSKKEGKDQELIQSSTTPDPGYQWESDNVTIRHHKREPRGPFPRR